jgi:glycosyltransferase involved in cell wall biosynthesis
VAGRRGPAARLRRRLLGTPPITQPLIPRLAYVSPMPPANTGIATYSRAVLEGLERTGFRRRYPIDVFWPVKRADDARIAAHRLGIYHLGNNHEFHGDIYRLAVTHPGLAVLHDVALDDFVRGLVARSDPLGHRARREATNLASRMSLPDAVGSGSLRRPWCAHVARHSRGIVVHSEFCRRYLLDFGCRTPIFVVPHPVVEREADLRNAQPLGRAIRRGLGLGQDDVLVVAAGDLNRAKQLDALLEGMALLDPAPRVHVALVGRRIPWFDVDRLVAGSGVADRVTVAADVSDDDFRGWLTAADVVANLRHPHRGEVSGSLMRAMQAGRPCIVSGVGTYLDLPKDAVIRVAPGPPDSAELAVVLRRLIEDRDLRMGIGERARAHIDRLVAEDATARGYAEAIEATLGLAVDPGRRALARWAGALADLGFTEEHLAEGYGVSYARALDELAPAPDART